MKKASFIILLFLSTTALFNSCKKEVEKTVLFLYVSKHPEGGVNVFGPITAEITGKIYGPVKEIDLVIEWFWEDGNHENSKMVQNETVIFNLNEEMTISTEHELWGYIFLNYYWIKVSWQDDEGYHMIESGKAYCTADL